MSKERTAMITLKIKNWFQKDPEYEESNDGRFWQINECESSAIEPYDEEKWKDGKTYEFDTLREVKDFCDSCDIQFKDEVAKHFNAWNWCVLSERIYIDGSEDNLIVFEIFMYEEWRD